MTLRDKVIELFNYRNIPQLLERVEPDENIRKDLMEKLIDIQTNIYHLDAVLESEWEILQRDLQVSWNSIYNALNFIGVASRLHDDYCKHIYRYQKHELSQREGKSILRFKMEYFYFYKSCDVKLIRRIIYERYPKLNRLGSLSDWRWFDLITEVNDDIDDVFEDIGTNNGNRFLLTIQQKDVHHAVEEYEVFIKGIHQSVKNKEDDASLDPLIINMTLEAIKDTLQLLETRKNEVLQSNQINLLAGLQLSKHI